MKNKYVPINLNRVRVYPIKDRKNKVRIEDFAKISEFDGSFKRFLDSLPRILAGNDFRGIVKSIVNARRKDKPVIFALGGHVIKCGLSPIIIDLMKQKIVTTIAINGGGSIHDFEISLTGATSEEVAEHLRDGSFGMVDETGRLMNQAIEKGAKQGMGMGEALGNKLLEIEAPYNSYSILATGAKLNVPVTVHVAIGTDIIHQHPSADGAAIGKSSFIDFRLLVSIMADLGKGGCFINIGSAVVLPEVFLKGLSIVRNLGYKVFDFTTANFDMVQHYRPKQNVVRRPTIESGTGYCITGHHEIMIPLLYMAILEELK